MNALEASLDDVENGSTSQDEKTSKSRVPYVDLTPYVSAQKLRELDDYLKRTSSMNLQTNDTKSLSLDSEVKVGFFLANGRKHANAIDLTDRDTSSWCTDAFRAYTSVEDFKVCRAHRGDLKTWRPNANSYRLPGVMDFISQALLGHQSNDDSKSCPILEHNGKISLIWSAPNSTGEEHVDIEFDDFVSEFVWIRPPSSNKQFYVRDPDTNEKHLIDSKCSIIWFDDHLVHNIEPSDKTSQYSFRIDGRFTKEIRDLICREGTFATQKESSSGGFRTILENQQNGPAFLLEPNDPPDYSDYDDDSDEDQ